MKIIEVADRRTRHLFLKLPKLLYKDDPFWVCPPDSEIESIFHPGTNRFFKQGEAIRWILADEKNSPVGRIAAFYYRDYAHSHKQPTGGIGFFECINDQEAANLLFDTSKHWLETRGMQAMDGPINFGENDNNWGLLVNGFIHPAYGMPYHFPYYKELFENYGFKTFYEQYSYHIDITEPFPERFWKIAEWVMRKPDFRFEHVNLKEADRYINDLVTIYNTAWSEMKENFTPLEADVVKRSFIRSRSVIDEELIWFVYHKDEPVALYLILPDINMILKHMHGRLHLLNKLRFLYYQKSHAIKRVRAVMAGVIPKYQGTGLESGIFKSLEPIFTKKPWITEIELSWVGDFNPKMRAVYEAVGGKLSKIHHTYRYLFDREAPFERYMPDILKDKEKFHAQEFQKEVYPDSGAIRKRYNYLKK